MGHCWLNQMKFANEDDIVIVGFAGQQRVVAFAVVAFCIRAASDLVQQMVNALPQQLQGYLRGYCANARWNDIMMFKQVIDVRHNNLTSKTSRGMWGSQRASFHQSLDELKFQRRAELDKKISMQSKMQSQMCYCEIMESGKLKTFMWQDSHADGPAPSSDDVTIDPLVISH